MGTIIIKNLSLFFGKKKVLDDISVTLESGMIHGIVGDNGSGKSVFLKCIAGLLVPDAGEVWIDEKRIQAGSRKNPYMGLIIEYTGFIDSMSAWHNLQYLANIRGKIKKTDIEMALRTVELYEDRKKKVGKFSLGMRQRLAIAQAIMESPDILIMDEPFNGLDKKTVEKMRCLFKQLRDQGKTIIISSHNEVDIKVLCDQVYEMMEGKLTKMESYSKEF